MVKVPIALLIACALIALTGSAQAAAPQSVSTKASDITAGFPVAAVNRSGLAVVAWNEVKRRGFRTYPSTQRVLVATSRGGRRFSRAVPITGRGAFPIDAMAAPNGSIAVLYIVLTNDDDECGADCATPVRMRVISRKGRVGRAEKVANSEVFGEEESVAEAASYPSLGVNREGDFEVALLDGARRPAITRRIEARRFTTPRRLTNQRVARMKFATNDKGAAVVGWVAGDGDFWGTAEWRTRPRGGGWGPVRAMGRPGDMLDPAVAVGPNGHTAFAARIASSPSPPIAFIARAAPNGRPIAEERVDGYAAWQLAIDPAGKLIASREQSRQTPGTADIVSNSLVAERAASGWGAAQRIGGGYTGFHVGFDRSGRGYGFAIGFQAPPTLWTRPTGGPFGGPVQLAPATGQQGDMDVNANGTLVATWMQGAPADIVATARR